MFPFTTASRPALGPTQPPVQWVPGARPVLPHIVTGHCKCYIPLNDNKEAEKKYITASLTVTRLKTPGTFHHSELNPRAPHFIVSFQLLVSLSIKSISVVSQCQQYHSNQKTDVRSSSQQRDSSHYATVS
jgi:hypothetical protein